MYAANLFISCFEKENMDNFCYIFFVAEVHVDKTEKGFDPILKGFF